MTYHQQQARICAAMEEPGGCDIGTEAFYAACAKHEIDPAYVEDAIAEADADHDEFLRHTL